MPVTSYLRGPVPIAVILLQHADSPISGSDPRLPTRKTFFDYVSPSGRGGLFEYYRDISRGTIDLSGSEVFGWWRMQYSFGKDYNALNQRETFMEEAARLAKEHGVDLTRFRGGMIIFTDGNGAGGNSGGRRAPPFHIGGPWWGPQVSWRVCNRCMMVTYTGYNDKGRCPAQGEGNHTHYGGTSDFDFLMFTDNWLGVTGDQGYRYCNGCMGLFNVIDMGHPCPRGAQHNPTGSWNYQVMKVEQRIGAASEDAFRKCAKCKCLVFGDSRQVQKTDENGVPMVDGNGKPIMERQLNSTHGTCAVNSGGRFGDRHLLSETNYALSRWWNEFHTMLIAHEVGHSFGMSESWRAKKPPEYPDDMTYGDVYDVMSAMNVINFDQYKGAYYKIAPPGLCASSLLKFGWLPKDGVVSYDFGGLQSISPGEERIHTLYSLSEYQPDSLARLPLNQNDAYYGASGLRAIQINSANHVYTVEYRTKSGWDRNFADNQVQIHETRSDFINGVRGWTRCTQCSAVWRASRSACAGGDVHETSSGPEYMVYLDVSNSPGNQDGWRQCRQCSSMYHNNSEGSCPGNADGTHEDSDAMFRLQLNNPQARGKPDWRWCFKCGCLFYGVTSLGNVAGACSAGGHHDATGSGKYSIEVAGISNPLPIINVQKGWKNCSKCQTLVFYRYGHCTAANLAPHMKAAVDPEGDFALKRLIRGVPEQLDPMYENNWRECIKCYQLFFNSGTNNGVCPSAVGGSGHDFNRGSADYALVKGEQHGDPNNKLYSDRGRRCERCLVLLIVDGAGNVSGNCAAGGPHGVQSSPVYNVVSFFRDFTYIIGRDADPAQGGRIFEFFQGDSFVDGRIGLRVEVGFMDLTAGTVQVTVKKL